MQTQLWLLGRAPVGSIPDQRYSASNEKDGLHLTFVRSWILDVTLMPLADAIEQLRVRKHQIPISRRWNEVFDDEGERCFGKAWEMGEDLCCARLLAVLIQWLPAPRLSQSRCLRPSRFQSPRRHTPPRMGTCLPL